jgi:branched-chain amino acid transport system substrate-binding protein
VKLYQDSFPADKRFTSPSLTGTAYYNDFNAVFQVLNKLNGDLSDGHKKFREELAKIELDAPNGKITLDSNRQAIGTNFITEVVELPNGDLVNKAVKLVPDVKQTLGFTPEQFAKLGLPSRTNPECKKSYN